MGRPHFETLIGLGDDRSGPEDARLVQPEKEANFARTEWSGWSPYALARFLAVGEVWVRCEVVLWKEDYLAM